MKNYFLNNNRMEDNVQKVVIDNHNSRFKSNGLLAFITMLMLLLATQINAQAFDSSDLNFNGFPGVNNATSLEFGPDGNLYVAEEDGLVKIYTIQRNGPNDYIVASAEVLTLVQSIPNHDDDDGSLGGPSNRQVTGITTAGTSANPIVYVSSSDRRRGAGGGGGDSNLDTNSGVITRLTKNAGNWVAVDMVRGLPRSEENHATNGMQFHTIGGNDWLLVTSGGFTNAGSPSNNFAFISEYALSAAVLAVDLTALEGLPIKNDGSRNYIYDIPTLDDPTRSNVDEFGNPASEDPEDPNYSPIDVNDPWGGNDGLNMGMLVEDSPVKMFSPGYRNTYDLIITEDGHVYVTDNGANGGWGGYPEYEGDASQVNNNFRPGEPGSTGPDSSPNNQPYDAQVNNSDHLNLVTTDINSYPFGSIYGGHPTPVRANANAGLFTRGAHSSGGYFSDSYFRTQKFDPDGTITGSEMDRQKALPANWPPVDLSLLNPDNADFRQPTLASGQNPEGPDDIIVVTWSNNTNGIAEYTASNFGGTMKGDLVAGKGAALHRVDRDPNTGAIINFEESKFSVSGNALGVDTRGDDESYPGTIWVANYNGDDIVVLEPNDFVVCILPGDPGYNADGDNDSDGYTNNDEILNGSDPCSGASQPSDFDGDLVSDLMDVDDDNDGINDSDDPLQIGSAVDLPVDNEFFLGTDFGGYLGLGFTGLMNNGDANPNYLDWQDDPQATTTDTDDILGGAIGAVTMYQTTGDAFNNNQEKAYQFGINVDDTSGVFTIHGRMFPPFHNFSATESQGMYIGDGFQDNYVKIVMGQNYQLSVVGEDDGNPINYISPTPVGFTPDDSTSNFDLYFVVNSATGIVQAKYAIDDGPVNDLGASFVLQGKVLTGLQDIAATLAIGIIGTADVDDNFAANWDFLKAIGSVPFVSQELPDLERLISASFDVIGLDSYFGDDGGVSNLVYTITSNSNSEVGATISGSNLTISYPNDATSTSITVRATDADSLFVEQTFEVTVIDQPSVLFRVNAGDALVAATDSPNPDWAANTGEGAQSGTGFTVNTGNISTHNIAGRDISLPDYAPQAIFANERWDPAGAPEMEWAFETGNGSFIVNLFMGNGFAGTSEPGQRIFDINMEGSLIVNDKDLSAEYGSGNGAMESYQVNVTDGILNIQFIHQTENPLINAIEILGSQGPIYPPITVNQVANQNSNLGTEPVLSIVPSGGNENETFNFEAEGLPPGLTIEPTNGSILGIISSNPNDAGSYPVSITVSKPSSSPVTINFIWTVIDPNSVDTVLYRVNAGGALTPTNDSYPLAWEEDQKAASAGAAGGNAANGTPSTYVNFEDQDLTFGAALPGTFVNTTGYPNSLFATERYNENEVPTNMQWSFPTGNGTYQVNLLFNENWSNENSEPANNRIFNVEIEDIQVLTNYRPSVDGSETNIAKVETFQVSVDDGELNIDFIKVNQNPAIKGIEIRAIALNVPDQWTSITNATEHEPRHENSFVQVGDKFYLFGGRESSDKIEIYDYQTNTWSVAASTAPFDFNHFQAVAYEGLIWVIGSFENNAYPNEIPSEHIWMYDPVADVWIEGPAIPVGRRRGSAGLVMYNDKFYVVAGNTIGHNGGYIPWFDVFDPATGIWTPLTDAPHARDHFHAAVVDDKLYVAGGRLSGGTGGVFAPLVPEVDVYDFLTGTWSTLPFESNLPNARAASSTVNFQGDVVIIGGEGDGQAYNNVDALDVATGNWTALDNLNNARHGTQAIVSGDGIWITSGSPNQGGGNQTNMEVYGVDNPTGIQIVPSTLGAPVSLTVPATDTEIFVLTNTNGNQGIYIDNIGFSGTNASNFSVVGSTSFLIPAGGSSSVVVAHSGSNEGEVAFLDISYGGSLSSSIGLTSGPAPSNVLYRVNAGGALIVATDAPNPDWSGDTDATSSTYLTSISEGNSIYGNTGTIIMTDASLPVGTPNSIFQTERYDNDVATPQMLWQFPVEIGAELEVRLYFAEIFDGITAAGQRVFDVSVEGTVPTVFDDIDPFARNGSLGAFILSYNLTVTDNVLDLEFLHLDIENPAIKAIEIVDVSGISTDLSPVVTNPGAQLGVEGDVVNLPIVATDGNDVACGPLTYSAENLPDNLSIDPSTGVISGTLLSGTGSGTAGAFIEDGGLVIMEAETDFVETPGGWNLVNEGGVDFLAASTNHFGNTTGQAISYNMEITNAGVYRFHMKSNISGTVVTDENDSWFKIENTDDVHFFAVQGGIINNTAEFENILNGGSSSKTIYYPAGNAMGRPNHVTENPGNNGYFKVYRSGGGANKWDGQTIDNNDFPIYAYFPSAGTYSITMSERSAGHKIDRFALAQIDLVGNNESSTVLAQLNGPESDQVPAGTPGASADSPYQVSVTVADACDPPLSTTVNFSWNVTNVPIGNPSAIVQVTPGSTLTASTFGNNSFLINNNGDDDIVNVKINTASGFLMDVVYDPIGTAGDSVAKCLTEGSSVGNVGVTVPANGGTDNADCANVFNQPHNGINNEEGYDELSIDFTDFNPGEIFVFGVDMDPTSIKGDLTSGDAGSISGFELIGATVSIEFASGVVYTSCLFDEGSAGGSDAIINITSNALLAPSISVDGSNASRLVTSANQIVQITGQPNTLVTLLRVDGRLYIDPGNPSVGYDLDLFEANEAMAKQLYTVQLNSSGTANIPVTLTQTSGATGTPNGGLNHFIAVTNGPSGENSIASNVIVLEFDPDAIIGPSVLVEITPEADLDASTYGASSLQITNNSTGGLQITNISIDLSTGILPDMVFDPTGAGGDDTSSPFTPNIGAAAVGLIQPANPAIDPFSQPRNGGYDIISLEFTEFDPGEYFSFTTDIDPNSIQGIPGAGNAGAVSGFELIGATITVTFSDNSTIVGSIYEDGSLGGGQSLVASQATVAPVISIAGLSTTPATVADLNQTVIISGTPGDVVSLLVMDSRLYIASGEPPYDVDNATYYANEAMAKSLYTGLIGPGGTVEIPVTLLQTQIGNGTPDGGLNQIVAVSTSGAYSVDKQVSSTSNLVTLLYTPNAISSDITISATLQSRTDYSGDYSVKLYEIESSNVVYDLIGSSNSAGSISINGTANSIAPGEYQLAVKYSNSLQVVQLVTLLPGNNNIDVGQLLMGDANGDNTISLEDFSILVSVFGLDFGETGYDIRPDFNGDSSIGLEDFSVLVSNFNTTGEEPNTP